MLRVACVARGVSLLDGLVNLRCCSVFRGLICILTRVRWHPFLLVQESIHSE